MRLLIHFNLMVYVNPNEKIEEERIFSLKYTLGYSTIHQTREESHNNIS